MPVNRHKPDHEALRIAILHYACAPIVGGVESIMTTHVRLLQEAGHSAYILAGRGDPSAAGIEGKIIPELDSRHPGILAAQKGLLSGRSQDYAEFDSWVARICTLLEEALEGATACIAHNAFTLHKNLALTVALTRLARRDHPAMRWIAWCHDLAWNNPLYTGELWPVWPWETLKMHLPNVTYVAISEQRRQEMAQLFDVPPGSITLVPNGIDPGAFLPSSPQMNRIRKDLDWDNRDWVFLAPVRVTRRKNLALALDIISAVRDHGHRPLLIVTGPPGPHNVHSDAYLQELLRKRDDLQLHDEVMFLAVEGAGGQEMAVSDLLISELYWWADALLMVSEQEGFGLPLLEAGMARLPIFCSALPVLREVGGDNANYFHLDEDPTKIAEMILNVLEKPGIASMRHRVLEHYTWERIFSERMLDLLQ